MAWWRSFAPPTLLWLNLDGMLVYVMRGEGFVVWGQGRGKGYFLASALDQFFSRAGGCFPDPLLLIMIDRPLLVRQVCAIVSVAFPRLHGCAIVVDGPASHVHAERRTTRIGGSEIDSVHVVDFALSASWKKARALVLAWRQ